MAASIGAHRALRFARVDPRIAGAIGEARGLRDAVDVFAWSLDVSDDDVKRWRSMLSDDERKHADRFVHLADRRAYVVAHGVLRRVIGDYCRVGPNALRFVRIRGGKPRLVAPSGYDDLRFNLTHCQDAAIVAVAHGIEVGVDLERERNDLDVPELAARFLTPSERQGVAAAPPSLRARRFLRTWVAKEAVTKAHGSGLALGLETFGIRLAEDGATACLDTDHPTLACAGFVVRMLPVPDGYCAALATPCDVPARLRSFARVMAA